MTSPSKRRCSPLRFGRSHHRGPIAIIAAVGVAALILGLVAFGGGYCSKTRRRSQPGWQSDPNTSSKGRGLTKRHVAVA